MDLPGTGTAGRAELRPAGNELKLRVLFLEQSILVPVLMMAIIAANCRLLGGRHQARGRVARRRLRDGAGIAAPIAAAAASIGTVGVANAAVGFGFTILDSIAVSAAAALPPPRPRRRARHRSRGAPFRRRRCSRRRQSCWALLEAPGCRWRRASALDLLLLKPRYFARGQPRERPGVVVARTDHAGVAAVAADRNPAVARRIAALTLPALRPFRGHLGRRML